MHRRLRKLCLLALLIFVALTMFVSDWKRVHKIPDSMVASRVSDSTASSGQKQDLTAGSWRTDVTNYPANFLTPLAVIRSKDQGSTSPTGKTVMQIRFIDEQTKATIGSGKVTIEPFFGPDVEVPLDEDGTVTLAVDPGEYTLASKCEDYRDWRDKFVIPEDLGQIQKTISLPKLFQVNGIVRRYDGQPQEGAAVICFQDGEQTTAMSGAGGLFEMELTAHEIEKIYAFKPPHPVAQKGPFSVDERNPPFITFTLPVEDPVIKFDGRVLDNSGRPVSQAAIRVMQSYPVHVDESHHDMILQLFQSYYAQMSTRTDNQGHFAADLHPDTGVVIMVNAKDFAPYQEKTDLVADTEKLIHLNNYPIFKLRIPDLDESELLSLKTFAQGRDGKGAGLYAASEKGKFFVSAYPVKIIADGIRKNLGIAVSQFLPSYQEEVVLTRGNGRITGNVTDDAARPVKYIWITVKSAGDGLYHFSSVVDFYSANGSFSLEHMISGKASISIRPGFEAQREVLDSEDLDVFVQDGRTTYIRSVLNRK